MFWKLDLFLSPGKMSGPTLLGLLEKANLSHHPDQGFEKLRFF
jgi:hypothetical protein